MERIKSEIKNLIDEWRWYCSAEAKYRCEAYGELLEFINSLQEEPVSKDLEEAAKNTKISQTNNKTMRTIKQICYGWIDEDEAIATMNILLDEIEKTFKEKGLLCNKIQCVINKLRE